MRTPLTFGTRVRVENTVNGCLHHGDVIGDDGIELKVRLYGQLKSYSFHASDTCRIAGTHIIAAFVTN